MRCLWIGLATALFSVGCGSSQTVTTTTPVNDDPVSGQQAVDEVLQLATQHCENGVHGSLDYVATDGPLLIVGTAGEVIEGRASLEEVNASYTTRDVEVRHDCTNAQRFAYAAAAGNVVWVEEAIRTHASWPGFTVDFPSQRTLIFERTAEGWKLRYYSLSVRLPDDQLDQAYAQPPETPAEAPAGGAEEPAAPESAPE